MESPSEKKRAVVLEKKDKNGDDKQFVEVSTLDLTTYFSHIWALSLHERNINWE